VFSVGLALARDHQDRIGNPLPVALISRTHPKFDAGRFERCVHGFYLSIVEEFPHPLPRSKGRTHPVAAEQLESWSHAEKTIDPAASQRAREEPSPMIAAMF
jgi:hypothetical protein